MIKKDRYLKKKEFEFVISTDDERLFAFIKKFDWINLHKRPKNLATDNSLSKLTKIVPAICKGRYILWTHVTSPLFGEKSYINFIKIFLKKKKNYLSAFSGNLIKSFIYNSKKKRWISHDRKKMKWPRTQDLDNLWEINNAAFISNRNVYIKKKDRLCENPLPIKSNIEEALDIDDIEDFKKLKEIKFNV